MGNTNVVLNKEAQDIMQKVYKLGGGSELYTYYIKAEDSGNMHYNYSCTFQCESSDINSYDTLAEYLIEKGFYLRGDRFEPDSVPLLNVASEGGKHLVTGLYVLKITNHENEYGYLLCANEVFISSGELRRSEGIINRETFSITLLTK